MMKTKEIREKRELLKKLTYDFLVRETEKEPQKIILNRHSIDDKIVFFEDRKKMREFIAETIFQTLVLMQTGEARANIMQGVTDGLDEFVSEFGVPKDYNMEDFSFLTKDGSRQIQTAHVMTLEKNK